jgi:hypothetical protein
LQGRRKEAYQVIADADKRGPKSASQCSIAGIYFALGDKDKGFARLNRAADIHEQGCVLGSPNLDDVRSDQRFHAVEARFGAPK